MHHNTPDTKQESRQWTTGAESTPKKKKTIPSAGEVTATVFWNESGVIFNDYLEKGKTINGEYLANLLSFVNDEIEKKDQIN